MGKHDAYTSEEARQEARRESWRKSKERHKDRDKAKRDAKPKPVEAQLQKILSVPGPRERRAMIALLARLMPKGA